MKRKTIIIILVILAAFLINDYILLNWSNLFPPPLSTKSTNDVQTLPLAPPSTGSAITDVIRKTLPTVVTISIKSKTDSGVPSLNPFNPFSFFQINPNQPANIEQNIASGFIVSPDGLVITNKHVTTDPSVDYQVITSDGRKYPVDDIYRDPLNDIAILKINGRNLTPLVLGDSSNLILGQTVIAIGTPLGEFRNTVTQGIISGLGRGIKASSPFQGSVEQLNNIIQTDAAINPGNSGGPLIDINGEAIGVSTALDIDGQNIGFAIPVSVVKTVLNRFNTTGQFSQPFLGIRYTIITPGIANENRIPQGAYIESVIAGSPAKSAGIQAQDIIIKIDNQPIDQSHDISKVISGKKVGDKISIELWRDGKTKSINLTLNKSQ